MLSLDEFFTERIGFGKAQYITTLLLMILNMNGGTQCILSSLHGPIFEKQLNLTLTQTSTMTSIFYIGCLIGSLIIGKYSDKYGRKLVLLYGNIFQLIVCCSFVLIDNYAILLIIRFLHGLSFALTTSVNPILFSQIVPLKYRGKGLIFLNFFFIFGKIVGFILGAIFLQNFTEGNWRMMMVLSTLSNFAIVVIILFCVQQSPRFLLATGEYQEAFQVLNNMLFSNKKLPITNNEKQLLTLWNDQTFTNQTKGNILTLFESKYRFTTIVFSCCWFIITYIYTTQLNIIPFIFGKQKKTLSDHLFNIFGEMPSVIVSILIIDRPTFGRKNSLIIFFFLSGCILTILSFYPHTLVLFMSRFFMKQVLQMIQPLTAQSYGTLIRNTGLGYCLAVGHLGSVIMPYITFSLNKSIGPLSVFLLCGALSFIGTIISFKIPYDTVGVSLDSNINNQQTTLK